MQTVAESVSNTLEDEHNHKKSYVSIEKSKACENREKQRIEVKKIVDELKLTILIETIVVEKYKILVAASASSTPKLSSQMAAEMKS